MPEIDGIFKTIAERDKAFELLRLALEELNPHCQFCVHVREQMMCTDRCKWQHEDEVRELLGVKE